MIARLVGRIATIGADHLVLDVNGVGYLVAMNSRSLERLGALGTDVTLLIETVVREDSIRLYGFLSADEKAWFLLLQDVQGVGAKVALALLGVLSPIELAAAVAAADHVSVSRAPGIGPKLAKRIVSELKDKVPAAPIAVEAKRSQEAAPAPEAVARADAVSALVNLGYSQTQALGAVDGALAELGADAERASVSDLIKDGLKRLSDA